MKKRGGQIKHGESHTRLYTIWAGMKYRCKNGKIDKQKYHYYDDTTLYNPWNDYISFRDWSLNNGYTDVLSIDRVSPKGNYCPENCRWVNTTVQSGHLSKPVNNTSGYVGVVKHTQVDRWCAIISIHNKSKHLGLFKTKREALNARNSYIIMHDIDRKTQRWEGEVV